MIETVYDLMDEVYKINTENGPGQEVYVIEECSELIKELCKDRRRKGDDSKIFEEACDVLLTTYIMVKGMNRTDEEINKMMRLKLKKAIFRFEENGEV